MKGAIDQTAVPASMGDTCPSCGLVCPPGTKYCGGCGKGLRDQATTHIGLHRSVSEEPPAGERKLEPQEGPLGALPIELGPYRVESVIGSGGMGWVYKAVDTGLARVV